MNEAVIASEVNVTRRSWPEHGVALGALIALILLGFHDAVTAALQVWWVSPTYSHCFLIAPISAWLIWEKRAQLAKLHPLVELRALWAMPPLLLVWWLGELSTINEVRQFAVIGLVQVAIVTLLGLNVYRVIWFAALYLFFLVPTGEYLIGPMQRFATFMTDAALNIIHLPHYTEGTVIELTNGRFEIAEACAGLRFLIATVALGVLFAYMMFRKWYKILLFLLACVVVPLVGNGLRVIGIILLAHYTNNEYGAGADHLIYGWGFNVAILLVLFLLGSLFRDHFAETEIEALPNARFDTPKRTAMAFIVSALMIGVGPAVGYWHDSRVVAPNIDGLLNPMNLSTWHSVPPMGVWHPIYPGIDAQLQATLFSDDQMSSVPVDLFVGYYGRARTGHSLTAHVNKLWDIKRWTSLSSGVVMSRLGEYPIRLDERIVSSATEKRLIWSTYWVDGAFTTSLLKVKLLQAQAAFQGHEGQALIAVSTVINGTDDEARARLSAALGVLGNLPKRLDSANRRQSARISSN